jgi:hypothetical protein
MSSCDPQQAHDLGAVRRALTLDDRLILATAEVVGG